MAGMVNTHKSADGGVAEWLGRGLQSPVRRFDSARRLQEMLAVCRPFLLQNSVWGLATGKSVPIGGELPPEMTMKQSKLAGQ